MRRLIRIYPDQAKARKAIAVTLNAEAVLLIRSQGGKHPKHLLSFRKRPIKQVSTKSWYAALERAGIVDFRWHDSRHTWASWHVQNATPLHALQELSGWGVRRWCGAMRTSRRSIWLRMRIDCARCESWRMRLMAQIRHSPQMMANEAMLSCCRNWRAKTDESGHWTVVASISPVVS